MSPAVLEELIGEIGSLASVYHKPAETFVGRGRIGADALRKNAEYALLCSFLLFLLDILFSPAWTTKLRRVKRR